jgi:hypothetical protein
MLAFISFCDRGAEDRDSIMGGGHNGLAEEAAQIRLRSQFEITDGETGG